MFHPLNHGKGVWRTQNFSPLTHGDRSCSLKSCKIISLRFPFLAYYVKFGDVIVQVCQRHIYKCTQVFSHLHTHTSIFYSLRTQNTPVSYFFLHDPGNYVPSLIKFDFHHFRVVSITFPLPNTRTLCSAKQGTHTCSCFLLYLLIFITKLSPPTQIDHDSS